MSKTINGSRAVILMAEDNDADARLAEEALLDGKLDNILYRVKDGEEALAFLRNEVPYEKMPRPDLILVDLNMPKMDGSEVLAEIRKDPALSNIPVVILTTSDDEADVLRSYRLQANCYIKKPVDFDQFVEVVQSIQHFWFTVVSLPERH